MRHTSALVRRSVLAGSWYPANVAALKNELEACLREAAPPEIPGRITALVSPHAGYAFSGSTAAHAYKSVKGKKFDTVVCIGPVHRNPIDLSSVFAGQAAESPLGGVQIDGEIVERLLAHNDIFEAGGGNHEGENPVEMQLPFLQTVLEPFRYVEVLVQDRSLATHIRTGEALAEALHDRSPLLVASTDLSHYPTRADAERADHATLEAIGSPDPEAAYAALNDAAREFATVRNLSCALCGKSAVLTIMAAARSLGASDGKILHYSNSADYGGGNDRVVGYGAVAYYAP